MNESTAANEVLGLPEACWLAGWLRAVATPATARRTITDPSAIGATYRIQTTYARKPLKGPRLTCASVPSSDLWRMPARCRSGKRKEAVRLIQSMCARLLARTAEQQRNNER